MELAIHYRTSTIFAYLLCTYLCVHGEPNEKEQWCQRFDNFRVRLRTWMNQRGITQWYRK